jgi:hypothetical protein
VNYIAKPVDRFVVRYGIEPNSSSQLSQITLGHCQGFKSQILYYTSIQLPRDYHQGQGDKKMTTLAPTPEKLSHDFDHILGRDLSGDLFILFENISASLKAMIQDAHFPQSKREFSGKI